MNYSAVFFDFDYTLVDSSAGILKCFRWVLGRYGFNAVTDDAVRQTIGMTLEDAFKVLTASQDAQRIAAMYITTTPPMPSCT